MKKVLALLLVLGMASMASATISLSVNGQPNPGTIELQESDHITLDVTLDPGFAGGEIRILLDNEYGELDWSAMTLQQTYPSQYIPPPVDYTVMSDWSLAWGITAGTTPGPQSIIIDGGNTSATAVTVVDMTLVDLLDFHCVGIGNVVVTLVSGGINMDDGFSPAGTVLDRLEIIQIPEPMTMSLLALGGLALIRRRRA